MRLTEGQNLLSRTQGGGEGGDLAAIGTIPLVGCNLVGGVWGAWWRGESSALISPS